MPSLDAFYLELEKLGAPPVRQEQPRKKMTAANLAALGALGLGGGYLAVRGGPGVYRGAREGLKTLGQMRSGKGARAVVQKGWRAMEGSTPETAKALSQSSATKRRMGGLLAPARESQAHLVRPGKGGLVPRERRGLRSAWQQGGVKGTAEELSRSGWTGKGRVSKYLPVGMKSWMGGLPVAMLPGEMKKDDPHYTGRGRAERTLGAVGRDLGWVASMPITGGLGPMIGGGMVMGTAGSALGRAVGRPIDLLTGSRQRAQARKGLKNYADYAQAEAPSPRQSRRGQKGLDTYIQYRRKQLARQQRRATDSAAY